MKKSLGVLIAFLFVAAAAFAGDSKYPSISKTELKQAIANKAVVLLDANGTESYNEGHIPGAIDFAAHHKDLASILPADKQALIVAYCGGEQCMAYKEAAAAAKKLGYTNIKHFAPGISGWKRAGEKTEAGM